MNKVVKERFKGLEKALDIQAREYERRLIALNGEAARIKESQEKSISVERFDGVMNQLNARFDAQQKEINELKEFRNVYQGRSTWTQRFIPWGVATILAIIAILLSYFQIRNQL